MFLLKNVKNELKEGRKGCFSRFRTGLEAHLEGSCPKPGLAGRFELGLCRGAGVFMTSPVPRSLISKPNLRGGSSDDLLIQGLPTVI